MFTYKWIFGILVVVFSTVQYSTVVPFRTDMRPNVTTCEQFERAARFSPYAVLDAIWKIIYFWSNNTELYPIAFSLAVKKRVQSIKEDFQAVNPKVHVEWEKATLIMDPRPGVEVLFLYAGMPGAFRALIRKRRFGEARPLPEPWFSFADVRMKMVDRVLGMMCCEDLTAFALVRMGEIPKTEEGCVTAASKLGYSAPDGRSYLYFERKKKEDEDNEDL